MSLELTKIIYCKFMSKQLEKCLGNNKARIGMGAENKNVNENGQKTKTRSKKKDKRRPSRTEWRQEGTVDNKSCMNITSRV